MEYRYYIIMVSVVLALQLLILNFARTIGWVFQLNQRKQRVITFVSYVTLNSIVLLHFTTNLQLFRPIALILVLLLFMWFVRVSFWGIGKVGDMVGYVRHHQFLRTIYPLAFLGLVAFSIYNAYMPKIVHYSVQLDKPLPPLRIGVASDLHLGNLVGNRQLNRLAEIFNEQKVDIILLPGDIMDDNVEVYRKENMADSFRKLTAPLGVYATLGNHDFFGHQQAIYEEITQAGIRVLYDQAVEIDGKFVIIGRNDDLVQNRPTASVLLTNVNTDLPILLLDHRPTDIAQHALLPIDLQISGHTHRGQIFPANIITHFMYLLDYGYQRFGQGHYIVTSGYGFWGIPMRLGSQAEVVIIDVKGK